MKRNYELVRKYYYLAMLLGLFDSVRNTSHQAFADKYMNASEDLLMKTTWKQFLLLFWVYDSMKRGYLPIISEMSVILGCSHQNTKKLADDLEPKGLLDIIVDPLYKSKLQLKVTKAGIDYVNVRSEFTETLLTNIFNGISEADLDRLIDNIERILDPNKNVIRIKTHEGFVVKASNFEMCKLLPRAKHKPYYKLIAHKGGPIQIPGINQHIIGFYKSKTDADIEVTCINSAFENNSDDYEVCNFVPVRFENSGETVMQE